MMSDNVSSYYQNAVKNLLDQFRQKVVYPKRFH